MNQQSTLSFVREITVNYRTGCKPVLDEGGIYFAMPSQTRCTEDMCDCNCLGFLREGAASQFYQYMQCAVVVPLFVDKMFHSKAFCEGCNHELEAPIRAMYFWGMCKLDFLWKVKERETQARLWYECEKGKLYELDISDLVRWGTKHGTAGSSLHVNALSDEQIKQKALEEEHGEEEIDSELTKRDSTLINVKKQVREIQRRTVARESFLNFAEAQMAARVEVVKETESKIHGDLQTVEAVLNQIEAVTDEQELAEAEAALEEIRPRHDLARQTCDKLVAMRTHLDKEIVETTKAVTEMDQDRTWTRTQLDSLKDGGRKLWKKLCTFRKTLVRKISAEDSGVLEALLQEDIKDANDPTTGADAESNVNGLNVELVAELQRRGITSHIKLSSGMEELPERLQNAYDRIIVQCKQVMNVQEKTTGPIDAVLDRLTQHVARLRSQGSTLEEQIRQLKLLLDSFTELNELLEERKEMLAD